MSKLYERIIKQFEADLTKYGTALYYERGAQEITDIDNHIHMIKKTLGSNKIEQVNLLKKIRSHEHGKILSLELARELNVGLFNSS